MSPYPQDADESPHAAPLEIEHIAYLLAQLSEWRGKGLITPSQEAQIRRDYALRHDFLQAERHAQHTAAAHSANGPMVPPLPPVPPLPAGMPQIPANAAQRPFHAPPSPPTPPAPPEWRLFFQKHALQIVFALATILVLAALRSLLQWDWVDTLAIRLLPAVPLGLTALFWTFGQKTRAENPWAAFVYHGVTCALLGFDLLTANRYWLLDAIPLRLALLLAFGLGTAAAGGLLNRWREIPYAHLLQAGVAGTLYMALQNLRPGANANDFRPAPLLLFGGAYLALAAVNLALAWQAKRAKITEAPPSDDAPKRESWSLAWQLWTHIHVTLTLVLVALNSAWAGAQPGEWAMLALAAGLLYGAGAQVLNAPQMAGVSGVLLAGSGVLWMLEENQLALQNAGVLLLILSAASVGFSVYNRRRGDFHAPLATAWRRVGLSNLVIATLLTWLYCARFVPASHGMAFDFNLTGAILAALCGLYYLGFTLREKERNFLYGVTMNFGVAILSGLHAFTAPEMTSATALVPPHRIGDWNSCRLENCLLAFGKYLIARTRLPIEPVRSLVPFANKRF